MADDNIRDFLKANFDRIDIRLEAIETGQRELVARVSHLEQSMTDLNRRFDNMGERLGRMFDAIHDRFTRIERRLDIAEDRLGPRS